MIGRGTPRGGIRAVYKGFVALEILSIKEMRTQPSDRCKRDAQI